MSWIGFNLLVKRSGQHETTVKRRIRTIKTKHLDLYEMLVKEGNPPKYKDPDFTVLVSMRATDIIKRKRQAKKAQEKAEAKPKRKPRKLKKEINSLVEDVANAPMIYSMEEWQKKLYEGLKTETDRIRFEIVVRIMIDYQTGAYDLDICCRMHGIDRHKLAYWCRIIAPVQQLYARARELRHAVQEDYRKDAALDTMDIACRGEVVESTQEHYTTYLGHNGVTYKQLTGITVTKTRLPRNVNAAMYILQNAKQDPWRKIDPVMEAPADSRNKFSDTHTQELEGKSNEELVEIINRNYQIIKYKTEN